MQAHGGGPEAQAPGSAVSANRLHACSRHMCDGVSSAILLHRRPAVLLYMPSAAVRATVAYASVVRLPLQLLVRDAVCYRLAAHPPKLLRNTSARYRVGNVFKSERVCMVSGA